MENNTMSAIELYMRRVFKVFILATPLAGFCAGLAFSLMKLLGLYRDVSWVGLTILDVFCLLYFVGGFFIVRKCEDENGYLKKRSLKIGKAYIASVILIQWNIITYLIPSRDFWAYAIFFTMFAAAFLDHKLLILAYAEIYGSIFVSWLVKGDVLLPVNDEYYTSEMALRGILMVLAPTLLWLIVYLIQTKLAHELEKIADYDTLTMLRNRRSMDYSINKLINKYNSDGEGDNFSLLMCDLDDFKSVNDTYGHDCGDEVLKYVANVITGNIGQGDLAFRYGGEELVVVVKGDARISNAIAEKIRSDIQKGFVDYRGSEVSLTITVGVASYKKGMSLEELIKLADSNLYIGKKNGKNQVVI